MCSPHTGFNYQYATMNVLVEEFNQTHPGQVDFVAIPTNNFGLQEPGANDEILSGLEHVRPGGGFKPLYKVAAKNECNGVNADPLFVWLKVRVTWGVTRVGRGGGSSLRVSDTTLYMY